MSDIPPTTPPLKPDWIPICASCYDPLEWRIASSTKNNNQGRWYAMCPKKTGAGKPEFFRWGSPRSTPSQTPTLSPTLASSSSLPTADSTHHHDGDSAEHDGHHCAVIGCKSTRLAAGCEKNCCRKHCLAFGGCQWKTHKLSATDRQQLAVIDPTLLVVPTRTHRSHSTAPSDASGSAEPVDSGSSVAPLPPPSLTPEASREPSAEPSNEAVRRKKGKTRAIGEVDMLANTRHPSQLPAVFTEGYAQQELVRQQKDARDSEQRDLTRRAANTIHAYGWSKDGEESMMFEVQDGFTYPQLRITASVLMALGLSAGEDGLCMLQYYNTLRSRWANIFQGHVVTLESRQVYLRHVGVTLMPDFDEVVMGYASSAAIPNLRINLTAERSSVRNANHRDIVKHTSKSTKPIMPVIEVSSGSEEDSLRAVGKRKAPTRSQGQSSPQRIRTTSGPRRKIKAERQDSLCTIEISSDDNSDDSLFSNFFIPSYVGSSVQDPIDVDTIILKQIWPKSFYTCEVAEVFEALATNPSASARTAFREVYGPEVRFSPSTFSEHLKRWNAALPSSRAKFIHAGKTDEGQYTAFMKENPAPWGDVKAAKKRLGRSGK